MRWRFAFGLNLALLISFSAASALRAEESALSEAQAEWRAATPADEADTPLPSPDGQPQAVEFQFAPTEACDQSYCDFRTPGLRRDVDATAGGWIFSGSWLYLMPALDDTYFALTAPVSTTYPAGTRVNNDFGYQSGFRVGAAYQFCADRRTLALNYTSLSAEQSTTVAGDFLWATVGRADFASNFENYVGTAASSLDFSYQRIDASFRQPWRVYDDDIYFHYGFEYANLELSEVNRFVSGATVGTVTQSSTTRGIGPEFGVGIDHDLWKIDRWMPGYITLDMLTTASLLIGQSHGRVRNMIDINPLVDVFDDNASRLIPALHAHIAFNYNLEVSNVLTTLTVGYQFDSYIGALTRVTFPDDVADGLAISKSDNFDIHGMFASATFAF